MRLKEYMDLLYPKLWEAIHQRKLNVRVLPFKQNGDGEPGWVIQNQDDTMIVYARFIYASAGDEVIVERTTTRCDEKADAVAREMFPTLPTYMDAIAAFVVETFATVDKFERWAALL